MEGKAIIAMYGNAARDILRSAAPGGLSPGSALDLAEVEAKYQSVAARLDVNEPDVLAVYKALLACRREYLRVHEWRREGCDKKCAPWYHSFQSKSFRPIATPSRKPGNISEPGEAIRKPSVPTGWWSVVGKHGKTVKILEEEAAPSKCLQRCGTLDSADQPCCVTTKNATSYSCSTMSACGRAPNTNSLFSSGGARNYVGPNHGQY